MSEAQNTPFRAIFTATVTPASIVSSKTKNDKPYLTMAGATVSHKGNDRTRTVMAFGKSAEAIQDLRVEGQPIDLAVQYDGGTVRVIGLPREAAPAAAEG